MGNILNLSKDESLGLLDMRKDIIEQTILDLNKEELFDTVSRVALVLDGSGSMFRLYQSGVVQSVIDRILPLAMQFDDNGAFELWIFNERFVRLGEIDINNYYDYINDNNIINSYVGGGTKYAPIMKDVHEKYIVEDIEKLPNYVIFITDGDNQDKLDTEQTIKDVSLAPIFFQFIGIGKEDKTFLKKIDTILGRYVDNANFFEIDDISAIDDTELYAGLLEEYPQWLALPEVQELISLQGNTTPKSLVAKKKPGLFGKLFGK